MRPFLIIAAFIAAAPVQAQEELTARYRADADACYAGGADAGNLEGCNGLLSQACMEREPGGMSNLGMARCVRAEALWWDEWLNTEYQRAMAVLREADAGDRVQFPEYAVRAERLRNAQRAWIAFRDADCAAQYALPGAGSMRILFDTGCVLDRTYERVTDLIAMRSFFE